MGFKMWKNSCEKYFCEGGKWFFHSNPRLPLREGIQIWLLIYSDWIVLLRASSQIFIIFWSSLPKGKGWKRKSRKIMTQDNFLSCIAMRVNELWEIVWKIFSLELKENLSWTKMRIVSIATLGNVNSLEQPSEHRINLI